MRSGAPIGWGTTFWTKLMSILTSLLMPQRKSEIAAQVRGKVRGDDLRQL
jgi:hypothetical protein